MLRNRQPRIKQAISKNTTAWLPLCASLPYLRSGITSRVPCPDTSSPVSNLFSPSCPALPPAVEARGRQRLHFVCRRAGWNRLQPAATGSGLPHRPALQRPPHRYQSPANRSRCGPPKGNTSAFSLQKTPSAGFLSPAQVLPPTVPQRSEQNPTKAPTRHSSSSALTDRISAGAESSDPSQKKKRKIFTLTNYKPDSQAKQICPRH